MKVIAERGTVFCFRPPFEGVPVGAVDVVDDPSFLGDPLLVVVAVLAEVLLASGAPVICAPGTVVPKVTSRNSIESVSETVLPCSSVPEQTAFSPSKVQS